MYDLPNLVADEALFAELREAVAGRQPVVRLREAKLKITPRCNLRCNFCLFWRSPPAEELTTAEACRVLDEAADLDCRKVHFSGGEPLLREDIAELAARGVSRGLRVSITSNGTLLTRELAMALLEAGVRGFSISVDSTTPRLHDRLRGVPGAHKAVLRGLRNLQRARHKLRARVKVRLNTVLTRHNYQEYPDLVALAGELGVDEITPIPVDEGGKPRNRLLPAQLEEYNEAIAPAVAELRQQYGFSCAPNFIYPFGRRSADLREAAEVRYARGYFDGHLCYAPWLYLLVNWRGDVFPCCMTRDKIPALGNVRQQSLADIYLGEPFMALRQAFLSERLPLCRRCDNFLVENEYLEQALQAAAPTP